MVWVLGAGFMGRGIAQICAQYGHTVCLIDPDKKALVDAQKNMIWSLEKLLHKGEIREDPYKIMKRVGFFKTPPNARKVELLIECIPEDLKKKSIVFSTYDKICPKGTIFASNTSALPIGTLAASTTRPDKFIGTHFSSPPVIQKLVEMIPCLSTSRATVQYTKWFLVSINREIIEVQGDIAGFVMNRIYLAAAAEAIRLLEQGIAPAAEIDRAMRVGFGWAKGPLEAADLAGVDVIRSAMFSIWQDSGNPMFYPPKTLTRLVEAGYLGRKTGRGFYEYTPLKKVQEDRENQLKRSK
jgi:3-hydroxybutyryl-CoA dehydrogenase